MQDKLYKLLENSYSPYSKFRVSAIVVTSDLVEHGGVNVENASYGASVCAERVAILRAVANGYKKNDFAEIHIMIDSDKISSCCFMCRQVITEFFSMSKEVFIYNNKGECKTYTVGELCPLPFTSEDL